MGFCGRDDDEEEEVETDVDDYLVDPNARAPVSMDQREYFDYRGPGPWWKCKPNDVAPPRISQVGIAGPETPATTVPALLQRAAQANPDDEALLIERPCPPVDDEGHAPEALDLEDWTTWTYSQYWSETRRVAQGFMAMGFQPFDTVNVWGFNSPEWHMSALAAGLAGGKVGGLYPTDTDDTAAYKVVHSGGAVVVLEDKKKLTRLCDALKKRNDAKKLKGFVGYGFSPAAGEKAPLNSLPVLSWSGLTSLASKVSDSQLDSRFASVTPGNCAALIYTSGTTGDPKAVMISHDNVIFETNCTLKCLEAHDFGIDEEAQERILSYLPLSHVAGMMIDIVAPITGTSLKPGYASVYFARPYDQKVGSIKDRLCAVRPTAFMGVPLVWEKIADKLRAIGESSPAPVKAISGWAKGLGLQRSRDSQLGGSGSEPMMYTLAEKLILKRISAALGLDQCKFAFTGAAPIRVDTVEYFGSLGIDINEVYGMSECCAACTLSTCEARQNGSVGFQMPGVEVKSFNVDEKDFNKKTECPRAPRINSLEEVYQGELCYRGRSIMMGYLANPDMGEKHVEDIKKKNAETIDKEGWLHSGDKGLITTAGMVKITGRFKELIIGAGGENIAPVPIEDFVKKSCDGIMEIMMVGDKRKYNVALVTLKAKGATGETPGTDKLDAGAQRVNPAVQTIPAAMDDPTWIKAITDAITAANNNGQVCLNNTYKIQKFTILPTNFSEEMGELTPTRKLKRKVVEDKYKDLIEKMYNTDGVYIHY
mmetsp:Transcript_24782/g.57568  ORF Transcript_24782/g.57568 Transcript_24782/m.57568 type:complete len:764 (-) Transcript_24782:78-2369(-)